MSSDILRRSELDSDCFSQGKPIIIQAASGEIVLLPTLDGLMFRQKVAIWGDMPSTAQNHEDYYPELNPSSGKQLAALMLAYALSRVCSDSERVKVLERFNKAVSAGLYFYNHRNSVYSSVLSFSPDAVTGKVLTLHVDQGNDDRTMRLDCLLSDWPMENIAEKLDDMYFTFSPSRAVILAGLFAAYGHCLTHYLPKPLEKHNKYLTESQSDKL